MRGFSYDGKQTAKIFLKNIVDHFCRRFLDIFRVIEVGGGYSLDGISQESGHQVDISCAVEHQGGIGMPEGMKGTPWIIFVDVLVDIDLDRAQPFWREHHAINPDGGSLFPLAERSQDISRCRYDPVAVIGLAWRQSVGVPGRPCPLFADLDGAGCKIYTVPGQAPDLTDPHAGPAGHQNYQVIERIPTMFFIMAKDFFYFFPGKSPDCLLPLILHLGYFIGGIVLDDLVADGVLQDPANSSQGKILCPGGKGEAIDFIHEYRRRELLNGHIQEVLQSLDAVFVGKQGSVG